MGKLEWRDGYSGESTDELIALEGRYRTDSIVLVFEEALGQKEARAGKAGLTAEENIVLAVEALEREVNNGGYLEFFLNAAEYVADIVPALTRIGCGDAAALTQKAIDALRIVPPVTQQAIEALLESDDEALEERLNECDDVYYATIGDLASPLLQFIKTHRDGIKLP